MAAPPRPTSRPPTNDELSLNAATGLKVSDSFKPLPISSTLYPSGFSLSDSFAYNPTGKTLNSTTKVSIKPLPIKDGEFQRASPRRPSQNAPGGQLLRTASKSNSTKSALDLGLRPLIKDHPEWVVEKPAPQVEIPILTVVHHPYEEEYGDLTPHLNFLVYRDNVAKSIISVKSRPVISYPRTQKLFNLGPSYDALHTLESGSEKFTLDNVPITNVGTMLGQEFRQFLSERLKSEEWHVKFIADKMFGKDLAKLELKHSRRITGFKIAVLYVKDGQTNLKDIFANKPPTDSSFYQFMDSISEKVDMKGWPHYRGDMGKTGEDADTPTYYTRWYQKEVIFHMSPYMSPEQHRRLCGNDIGVLIYYDDLGSGRPFVPFGSIEMGTVPHVFTVVQQHPTTRGFYRVASFKRPAVKEYSPSTPPHTHYLAPASLKNYLLTKLHNGYLCAQACPPMDRLFKVPRREGIKALGIAYEHSDPRLTSRAGSSGSISLEVKVGSGRKLVSKDKNGLSDPYLEISCGDQECRTKTIKKTLDPHWNQVFEFHELAAEDEITVVCWDQNSSKKSDYMGEFTLLVKTLQRDTIQWIELWSVNGDEVAGEIELYFTEIDVKKRQRKEKMSRTKSKEASKRAKNVRRQALAESLVGVGF